MNLFQDGQRTSGPLADKWHAILSRLPGYDPFRDAAGCWFDPKEAERRINFFPICLTHIEGPKKGDPFTLEPWQQAYIGNLFGWRMRDDAGRVVRRYRESLLYVPRGNGKTTISAGIVLSCLLLDGEGGAQCYSAAAEKDQASLLFRHCSNMIAAKPALEAKCRIYRGFKSIVLKSDQASFYRSLSADAPTKEGFNTHCCVIDELHAQPNRNLVDVLVESTKKKRAQPLIVYITTADYQRDSICNEIHDYAKRVRDGGVSNPRFLPAVYEAEEADDWRAEATWRKANPNLDVSISLQDFRDLIKKATDIPALENSTKRKHLNIKTRAESQAIPMDQWHACGFGANPLEWRKRMLEELKGQTCIAGLDLGATNDLTADILLFPKLKPMPVLPFFWATEAAIDRRRRNRIPYDAWVDQGFVFATPGNEVDYGKLIRDIIGLAEHYPILPYNGSDSRFYGRLMFAVDRLFQGYQLTQHLDNEGLPPIPFGQGFLSMAIPTRRLLEMIAAGQIDHGNNPVLTWMAGNATTRNDEAGNVKFDKKRSTEKIDGIVGLTMCVGLAEMAREEVSVAVEVW